jgi:hypothetical protein
VTGVLKSHSKARFPFSSLVQHDVALVSVCLVRAGCTGVARIQTPDNLDLDLSAFSPGRASETIVVLWDIMINDRFRNHP